jgi:hypothetical protein
VARTLHQRRKEASRNYLWKKAKEFMGMKKNQGSQARKVRGAGPKPAFRRCGDCHRVTLKSYFHLHVCPLNSEGEIDVLQEKEKPKGWKARR